MNEVAAVKEDAQRLQIEHLLADYGEIYLDVWKLGVNTALRISDLLSLTMDQARAIVPDSCQLTVVEHKTGKARLGSIPTKVPTHHRNSMVCWAVCKQGLNLDTERIGAYFPLGLLVYPAAQQSTRTQLFCGVI